MSSSGPPAEAPPPDRIGQIIDYLNDDTLDQLPDHLKFKYEDGFDFDNLEEELASHPFFCTELPDPSKPLPPLLDAFQQLKYSETENTPHELSCNHKEDGLYHFKLKKYRIASTCFTQAISHELKSPSPDATFLAQLYNNRSACMWFIQNYRTCVNDCREAMKHLPNYFKAFKRALQALAELKKWDEVEEMCGAWEGTGKDENAFICSMQVRARKGKAVDRVSERKLEIAEVEGRKVKARIMAAVRERGVRLRDEAFLDCDAANGGRVVSFGEEGELRWPVLFMYPQYSQSDLVEAFNERDSFVAHLSEMLDGDNSPPWDREKEYHSGNVELAFMGDNFVRVEAGNTLLSVMQQGNYVLPGNGVPSFFVLAKGNQFCQDFVERCMGGDVE